MLSRYQHTTYYHLILNTKKIEKRNYFDNEIPYYYHNIIL